MPQPVGPVGSVRSTRKAALFQSFSKLLTMKAFKILLKAFGLIAAVAIALGAYWHIFTLGACWLLIWASNKAEY